MHRSIKTRNITNITIKETGKTADSGFSEKKKKPQKGR